MKIFLLLRFYSLNQDNKMLKSKLFLGPVFNLCGVVLQKVLLVIVKGSWFISGNGKQLFRKIPMSVREFVVGGGEGRGQKLA